VTVELIGGYSKSLLECPPKPVTAKDVHTLINLSTMLLNLKDVVHFTTQTVSVVSACDLTSVGGGHSNTHDGRSETEAGR